MIKDTNPDHYKVEGANFIEYMNDPKISGFGNWMFANGFNSGVWASTNWISVKDRLPDARNDEYLVSVETKHDREHYTTTDHWVSQLQHWYIYDEKSEAVVTHWMPLPEPPEVTQDDG